MMENPVLCCSRLLVLSVLHMSTVLTFKLLLSTKYCMLRNKPVMFLFPQTSQKKFKKAGGFFVVSCAKRKRQLLLSVDSHAGKVASLVLNEEHWKSSRSSFFLFSLFPFRFIFLSLWHLYCRKWYSQFKGKRIFYHQLVLCRDENAAEKPFGVSAGCPPVEKRRLCHRAMWNSSSLKTVVTMVMWGCPPKINEGGNPN